MKQDAELLLSRRKAISSKLEQAVNYMLNNWSQLINYVNVGNANIDNNICERAVRPFTVLRKNFGGFGSVTGAETASVYLTMVETCKLRGLSPKTFFTDFFDQIVAGNRNYEEFLPEILVKKI